MERSEFIKVCGGACLGMLGLSALVQSCGTSKYIQAEKQNDQLEIEKIAFLKQEENQKYHKYLVVRYENAELVVFRKDELTYSALPLVCTHQGNPLQVSGNILTCAAHGSEFSESGDVLQGPATASLKKLNVSVLEKTILIQLT